MFADPQSLSLGGAPYSFPRIGSDLTSGIFENATLGSKFTLSHVSGKRDRHVARLDSVKTAADPLQPTSNKPYSMSTYLVVDVPLFGYSDADISNWVAGLTGWLTTGTNTTKFIGGES